MIVIVMGVAGSGKTTVGRLLAESVGCQFLDADTLHPAANMLLTAITENAAGMRMRMACSPS